MPQRRANQIAGQFAPRPIAMLESAAMRALSLAARKALDRIEIEHAHHGGCENGRLPITYRQFEKWGVRRDSVASAIRELVALGFVEVTRRGYGGAAEVREPSLYRLTFRPAWDAGRGSGDGTHEWRQITTLVGAKAIAAAARKGANPRNVERGKKQNATPQIVQFSPHDVGGETGNSRPPKRGVQSRPTNWGVLSISRVGTDGRAAMPADNRRGLDWRLALAEASQSCLPGEGPPGGLTRHLRGERVDALGENRARRGGGRMIERKRL